MKTTWTTIVTSGILKSRMLYGRHNMAEALQRSCIRPINRKAANPEVSGFAPINDPMSETFAECGSEKGNFWSFFVRQDRVCVPNSTVKLLADKFIKDGAPGLDEFEQKIWDGLTLTGKNRHAVNRIKEDLQAKAPETITLTQVYLDRDTEIIRVAAAPHSSAVRHVLKWLEHMEDQIVREAVGMGQTRPSVWHSIKVPEFLLLERFGSYPQRLLEAIPGEFNNVENDGDQTDLLTTDVAGILRRLEHYKRDLLTWVSYRALVGRNLVLAPLRRTDDAYKVEIEVSRTCTIRKSERDFTAVNGDDVLSDVSTSASLRSGAKIVQVQTKFTVEYANGLHRVYTMNLGSDLVPTAVEMPIVLDKSDLLYAAQEMNAAMIDVEELLKRLLCSFAWLRSGLAWGSERHQMLMDLYDDSNFTPGVEASFLHLEDEVPPFVTYTDETINHIRRVFQTTNGSRTPVNEPDTDQADAGLQAAAKTMRASMKSLADAGVETMTVTVEGKEPVVFNLTGDDDDARIDDIDAAVDAFENQNDEGDFRPSDEETR